MSTRGGWGALIAGALVMGASVVPAASAAAQPAPRAGAHPESRAAATAHVDVGRGGQKFVDQSSGTTTTTIGVGDTVQWDWVAGSHSTKRSTTPETWNSGIQSVPFTFSHTFESAGTYVYFCQLHGSATFGMRGTVVVQATPPPTLSVGNVSLTEGNAGTTAFDFPVTLSAASEDTVSVHFATSAGTATSGDDFTAATGTLTFGPGVTEQTAEVMVNADATPEPNETFLVTLSQAVNATIADGSGVGTIQNDDGEPPPPEMSIGDASVTEGNTSTTDATFTVTLSSPAPSTVTAHFETADGTATAGPDYHAAAGTVTFSAGESSRPVKVTVRGDRLKEPDETFTVILSAPVGATLADGEGAGVIQDDGDVCTIVGTGGPDVLEGSGAADTICGLGGNDTLRGMGGADTLLGSTGSDQLYGGAGADTLKGSAGDDTLRAVDDVSGNDSLSGGDGTDSCRADPGDTVRGCP